MAAAPLYSGRTTFGDIVAEFWAPRKVSRKAVIICDGCPSVPSKARLATFFARKGYWVFHIRYRGTWESKGEFLKYSPHEDVLLVARALNKVGPTKIANFASFSRTSREAVIAHTASPTSFGRKYANFIDLRKSYGGFENIYDKQKYFLDINKVVVLGVSFGGAAAILSSRDPVITKAIAIAPVIDWRVKSDAEPFAEFLRVLTEGFPGVYRGIEKNAKKLLNGRFYNPAAHAKGIDPKKLLVIHARDDAVVPVGPLRTFAKKTGMKPIIRAKGGHLSSLVATERTLWKKIDRFLKHG